ncbi:urease accessory protein UreD [Nitratireductor sp. ZSWI3]|uniref:urease accessory protein UreD n=1 Tax=Nitratireductor sp. ZSWI3 TaxID=2966359 RepID=UPI0021504011|nr:urease accessory protein UreD [Nitratireductor sp. ZSWI3]MCR4266514.1 urease accessory protein UreD [Nitratireductor sp. ZSWI3]
MTTQQAASLSEVPLLSPSGLQRARGTGRIGVVRRDGRTRLKTFYQEGCAKIRLPRAHHEALEAVIINTSGGLTGGDRLNWHAEAGAETRLSITTQACERIYRSAGGAAEVATRIVAHRGAHVDWLPQETILFEQSRLKRSLTVELAAGATFTAVEAVLLGREAMGETALTARLSDQWRIFREGRLIHAEATQLAGTGFERHASSLLAGSNAFATLLAVVPDAEERLAAVRRLLPAGTAAGASAQGERLVVRLLAPSGLALRRILAPAIAHLSGAGALPRLWTI